MEHSVFTIITPVENSSVAELHDLLTAMGYLGETPRSDPLNFASLELLHYASLFLYDDPDDGCFLVFESNIDLGIEAYFDAVIDAARDSDQGECLLGIFRCCQGFESNSLDDLAPYWLRFIQMPNAAFIGPRGRTRNQILLERRVQEIADQTLRFDGTLQDEKMVAEKVRDALDGDTGAAGYKTLPTGRGLLAVLASTASFIFDLVITSAWALTFLVLGIFNLVKEATAHQDTCRLDGAHVRSQRTKEDFLPSNHMASIVHLHHDWSRATAKRAGFAMIKFAARYIFRNGRLGSIPTIQFAHWSILNNGRRLMFVSNYEGSWDSYLDDFTLKAGRGLTVAWAHGIGFPRSRFMVFGGAANGPEFIDWARGSMVPTLVWYSAYPGISVANINRNSQLRSLIANDTKSENKGDWLGRV